MNSYRRVILATLIGAIALATTALFLRDTQASGLFGLIVSIEALADIGATLYLGYLAFSGPKPRQWLLLFLFVSACLITVGVDSIGILVALRFFGLPPLANGIGILITGMSIVGIGAVPIMKATLFWLVNRDTSIEAGLVVDRDSLIRALLDHEVEVKLAQHDTAAAADAIMHVLARVNGGSLTP